jgi:Fe2+ or Zn2+ uptake regulation protein
VSSKQAHTATVYRAVPLLVNAGLVRATLVAPGDSPQYEVVFAREQHCAECGRLIEFQSTRFRLCSGRSLRAMAFSSMGARAGCMECRRAHARA